MSAKRPRILFALPGLHTVARGAEVAFESVAEGLAKSGAFEVTLIGSGEPKSGRSYRFLHSGMIGREVFRRWPSFPPLRSEYRYEELSFAPGLYAKLGTVRPDIAVTCSYPFVSWILGRAKDRAGRRAAQVFVTQNGDWPARRQNAEYKLFSCDGLVCTNREYFERHQAGWNCRLIPNGVDAQRFQPGRGDRAEFGVPEGDRLIVMASALIPSKFVQTGIRAAAFLPGVRLLIAGDGPERDACDTLGRELLGDRYRRLTLPADQMPAFYRLGDAFMHLSQDEAFGNVYIEALASGVPVVAHDYDTTRWICDGHGILGDTSTPEQTATLLKTALEGGRPTTSEAAWESIRARFDWPVIVSGYAGFFSELMERRKKQETP